MWRSRSLPSKDIVFDWGLPRRNECQSGAKSSRRVWSVLNLLPPRLKSSDLFGRAPCPKLISEIAENRHVFFVAISHIWRNRTPVGSDFATHSASVASVA